MSVTDTTPFHLLGNFAPVSDEISAVDLPVKGAIPGHLRGRYLRNGPNPRSASAHWFMGEGMVHGVEIRDGRAVSYRNRWVRTASFTDDAPLVRPDFTIDLSAGTANTSIVRHGGRTLALVESSWPYQITDCLDTVGPWDFDGRLTTAMTAHPKICPVTGELHFFGYGFMAPYLTYHRADVAGRLVHSQVIEVPAATMMHDFAITSRNVVFLDLPVVFDLEMALSGSMPFRWDDSHGARIGVMSRKPDSAVRWFDIEPCYVFHVMNAFDDGDRVVVDGVRYRELWRDGADQFAASTLHRWTVDLVTGHVGEETVDDRECEFPRVDDRLTGRAHRIGYAVATATADEAVGGCIRRYDLSAGTTQSFMLGPGRHPGEAVFVPAEPDADEGDGCLMTLVYDEGRQGSDLVILDAADTAAPPLATITLPHRVPFGFHGTWLAD